jgi:hypothetical protein
MKGCDLVQYDSMPINSNMWVGSTQKKVSRSKRECVKRVCHSASSTVDSSLLLILHLYAHVLPQSRKKRSKKGTTGVVEGGAEAVEGGAEAMDIDGHAAAAAALPAPRRLPGDDRMEVDGAPSDDEMYKSGEQESSYGQMNQELESDAEHMHIEVTLQQHTDEQ